MRKKLQHILSVFVAIFAAIPIANAAASDYNVAAQTPGTVWSKTFTAPGADAYQAAVLPNGYLYVIGTNTNISGTIKTLYRINENGVVTSSAGYETVHYGLAADDNGKIILLDQAWSTSTFIDYVSIRKPNASTGHLEYVTGSHFDISAHNLPSYCYYIDATGDLENGTGYIWFPPVASNADIKVVKTVRTAGATTWTTTKTNYTLPFKPGRSDAYLQVYESDEANNTWKFLFQNTGENLYDCTLSNGTITATPITLPVAQTQKSISNSHIFFLGGHKMLAYNTGTVSRSNQFIVYDMTTKTTIATVNPFSTTVSGANGMIGSWINSLKVSETQTDLFVYSPAVGASRLSLKATAITNPVTSLSAALVSGTINNVAVTWAKPSAGNPTKYAVSYSTDGGASWSNEVETTNLNYTYTNLADGTYTFKVRAYYGGSSTWGAESQTTTAIDVVTGSGAPISNLAYKYVKNTETNAGRQDIVLNWTAPDASALVNTTLAGYKVYRGETLIATLDADVTTYIHAGVTTNYTYTVVPLFSGLAEDKSLGQSVTPTEVKSGVLVAPIFTETRNYAGYSLVELFYKMPSYAPYKPLYYNLYRDGALIQAKLQSFNTLDETIVQSSATTTIEYQIEAVYGAAADSYPAIDSIKSEINTVTIAPRDIAKTRYILQEIYNVPIDEIAEDKKPALLDSVEYYRQGQFYDGHWYIAQRADNLSLKAQELAAGATSSVAADDKSGVEGSTGGVVKFKATTKEDILAGLVGKPITTAEFSNVGIAMDDKGTIFVRNNNYDKLKATVPTGHGTEAEWGWIEDSFMRRITEGTFFQRNADGTYTEIANKLDLTALWTDNRWIDDMTFTGVVGQGQVHGRSDYYSMYGDVMSAEGGYLILSPSWTRTAFKVKIANGAYVSHEIIEFNRYENTGYVLTPGTGAENYGFKLDGRDEVTLQIRSNGYYAVHDWATDDWHPIFTADSRINNAGGASVEAFGTVVTQEMIDAEGSVYEQADLGKSTGELFIVTPQSMHSRNVGDFLISRATKTNASDLASEGTLMPSAPVAMKVQTDARSNSTATNANGNWFHAEEGTYSGPTSATDPCVDIYQYVPGTRFARYRLIPSDQFPPVQPTLDITTAYNGDKTDITHFDGVATWKRPAGFGRSGGEVNAKVVSYLFQLLNSKNEVVASAELPELYKTDGEPVDDDYVYDFNYNDTTSKTDIDFGRYTVSVQVKYQTSDLKYHLSEKAYAEDIHDYPAAPAEDLAVHVFKQANSTYSVENKDGTYSTVTVDNYRVELDFNAAKGSEPVTHYTIKAARTAGGFVVDTINLTDFQLHDGISVVNGIERANYTIASEVPGTYDFRTAEDGGSKAPFYHKVGDNYGTGGQSRQQSVLTWHHVVAPGTYGSTVARSASIDEPSKWLYYVDANYAAKNTYIAKTAPNNVSTTILVETGVEVVGNDATGLKVYPVPASTEITVKSGVAINSIVIINDAGTEVMTAEGNGDTTVKVNIEGLAAGIYFVKVDGNAPVKIIKK